MPASAAAAEIEIVGMHCDSCVQAITAELDKLEGVYASEADFEKGWAKVMYEAASVKPEAFVEAIDKLGYEAKLAGS